MTPPPGKCPKGRAGLRWQGSCARVRVAAGEGMCMACVPVCISACPSVCYGRA